MKSKKSEYQVLSVVGARPQFIKAASICRAVESSRCQEISFQHEIVHTGQHYDQSMSDSFFAELSMPDPAVNLGVGSGRHGEQTGRMLERLEEIFVEKSPGYVLVYGDTNSTLAGALAAAKLNIPIGHVEAGMRCHRRDMPEEINRLMTDVVSDFLFTTGPIASRNLLGEGYSEDRVFEVGDLMLDAFYNYQRELSPTVDLLDKLGVPERFALVSFHRAENTDRRENLEEIVLSLNLLSDYISIVLPLHPRTEKAIKEASLDVKLSSKIVVTPPLKYRDTIELLDRAVICLTDSGGLQKESYFVRTPCLILREETEWQELTNSGWARLAGVADGHAILRKTLDFIDQGVGHLDHTCSLFGDGDSAKKILEVLVKGANC